MPSEARELKRNLHAKRARDAAAGRYPPGPRSRFPVRQLRAFRRDPLAFLSSLAREYGDIAYAKLGSTHLYALNHPDYIKDVLVTHHQRFTSVAFEVGANVTGGGLLSAQGEAHRRQRRLVQPAFYRERIPTYGAAMVSHALRWCERHTDGVTLEMREEMMRLTLGIIAETMFGADVTENDSIAGEVRTLTDAAAGAVSPRSFPFGRLLEKLPVLRARRFDQARDSLDAWIYRMIRERRERDKDRDDLLSMLLLAEDEEGGRLTDRQLRDEILTILLAGHDTTATALTWAWYLLARHPEVERRLHSELDRALGDRPPATEDLPRLEYVGQVFAETLRLYAPGSMIFRRALVDHPVGDYVVPAGGVVVLSHYVMHRDPRFYAAPDAFNPDRWTPEARAARPRFSYFPFGAGPRVCIGEGYAWMEGILLLATLAQRWRPRLIAGGVVVPEPSPALRPRGGLPVRLERRRALNGQEA